MRGKAEARAEITLIEEDAKTEPDVPDSKASPTAKESPVAQIRDRSESDAKVPKTAAQLEIAMTMAFMDGKAEEGEDLFKKLIEAETEQPKRDEHSVWHAYLQYTYGKRAKGLEELQRLAAEPKTKSEATFYLGGLYQQLNEFGKAIESYRLAAESAPTDLKPARLVKLASAHAASGEVDVALSILTGGLDRFHDAKHRATLYQGIAGVFEARKDQETRAIALELALECDPHDTDLRFQTAYAYSNSGLRDLALFHYTAELAAKPNESWGLNNLGVECQHFGMPLAAVRYYRSALKQKNTLGGANLAYLLMNAGFEEEARKLLDEVKNEKDVHPNVASAIAALAQKEQAEEETRKKILDRAVEEQRFIKQFGRLRLTGSPDHFAGKWTSADGQTFELVRKETKLTGIWMVEKTKRELTGTLTNGTAKIELSITPEHIFLSGYRRLKGYAYVSHEGQRFRWMLFDGQVPEFAEFIRIGES
jgi:tetratricopeptide (TPR) repeat protein